MLCCCFCNQKTVYELRISDWSSDVCSPDLLVEQVAGAVPRLGQRRRPIGEGRRLSALALLIKVEQRLQRDPAVDDIFAVVAGIVPPAGDVVAARSAGQLTIARASWRESVCQDASIPVVALALKKQTFSRQIKH